MPLATVFGSWASVTQAVPFRIMAESFAGIFAGNTGKEKFSFLGTPNWHDVGLELDLLGPILEAHEDSPRGKRVGMEESRV